MPITGGQFWDWVVLLVIVLGSVYAGVMAERAGASFWTGPLIGSPGMIFMGVLARRRVVVDDDGITVVNFRRRRIAWGDVDRFEFVESKKWFLGSKTFRTAVLKFHSGERVVIERLTYQVLRSPIRSGRSERRAGLVINERLGRYRLHHPEAQP
jgi:hypothetical protein